MVLVAMPLTGPAVDRFGGTIPTIVVCAISGALVYFTYFDWESLKLPVLILAPALIAFNMSRHMVLTATVPKVPAPGDRAGFMSISRRAAGRQCGGAFLSSLILATGPMAACCTCRNWRCSPCHWCLSAGADGRAETPAAPGDGGARGRPGFSPDRPLNADAQSGKWLHRGPDLCHAAVQRSGNGCGWDDHEPEDLPRRHGRAGRAAARRMTLMAGGFGICGIPENLIAAVKGIRRHRPHHHLQQLRRSTGSAGDAAGDRPDRQDDQLLCRREQTVRQQYLSGALELEFNPRARWPSASGPAARHPAFFTRPASARWWRGKEVRDFDGETYVMERGLIADLAIVKAHVGDTAGNLVFRKTARNFNPMMATAGRVTVAEVEELVEPGTLDPDQIHTPASMCSASSRGRPTRSASSSAPHASGVEENTHALDP